MRSVFADPFFFIALLDERDSYHQRVRLHLAAEEHFQITTRWVLVETANHFCASAQRADVAAFLLDIESDPDVQIVEPSDTLYHKGMHLYSERPDKAWSLTDCISFVVMQEQNLTDALTRDRHFAQAGFAPLFS
jgi:predicted nucleic acid-binding protein